MSDTIARLAQDPTMPIGRCIVMVDGNIRFAGRLGLTALPFIRLDGALVIMNPADFEDAKAFVTAVRH